MERLTALDQELEQRKEEVVELRHTLSQMQPKLDFDELKGRFEVFSEIETIRKLEDEYIPKIREFGRIVDSLKKSNMEMRECVAHFDHTLSLKCNKSEILSIEYELGRNYMSIDDWPRINEMLAEAKRAAEKVEGKIDREVKRYEQQVQEVIAASIQNQMEAKYKEYQRVADGFSQFFGQDELGSILDRKADLELIRRIQDQKANKQEMAEFTSMVEDSNLKLQ